MRVLLETKFTALAGLTTIALGALAPIPSHAQSPESNCAAPGGDIFASSRRARRILGDYEDVRVAHTRELDRLERVREQSDGASPQHRVALYLTMDHRNPGTVASCTTGGRREGTFLLERWGVLGEYEWLPWDVSLQLQYVASTGHLTFRADLSDEEVEALPEDISRTGSGIRGELRSSQWMLGARLQVTEWAAMTTGVVRDATLTSTASYDGARIPIASLPPATVGPAPPPRLFLSAEIPRYRLVSSLLADLERGRIDTASLGVHDLALPIYGWRTTARAYYLEDEEQIVTRVSLDRLLRYLEVDTAIEYLPLRLRHLALRAELSAEDIFVGEFDDEELAAQGPGIVYLGGGIYAEGSVFNSRILEERTGLSWVRGARAGAHVSATTRTISLSFRLSYGVNSPWLLGRIPEAVGRSDLAINVLARVGW
jgi:hypothetical protein